MRIRGITFDFWGTVFRDANGEPRQRLRIEAFCRVTGAQEGEADEALRVVWKEFERVHREEQRTLRPLDAVRMAAGALRVTIEPDVEAQVAEVFATAILTHSAVPVDDALKAVCAAAAVGPVGLISDTGVSPGSSLRQLLDRHDFTPHFNVTTFSDEVGLSKPQAPIFEITAARMGVQPNEMLHLGDLEHTDIAGAKAFGAKAGLFTGINAACANGTKADHIFATWREFINALPGILE
jgi:putative hydrolase of the HAD superfamily